MCGCACVSTVAVNSVEEWRGVKRGAKGKVLFSFMIMLSLLIEGVYACRCGH